MVGSGLIFIPWAFNEAGILLGIILTLLAFSISFTTQYFVMKSAGNDSDYTETLKKTFGIRGWQAGMTLFIFMLSIPIILYFQLLSQLLYPILSVFIHLFNSEKDKNEQISTDMDFSQFSYSWTCIIIFLFLFTITAKRDIGIFVRINTYGVIFTIIIITFICSYGFYALFDSNVHFQLVLSKNEQLENNFQQILLFGQGYNHLMGILGGGFYLHNISIPIYRNSKNPKNNVRDMFIGFLCVALSYIFCGVLGTFGFANPDLFKNVDFKQNFLNMFSTFSVTATIIRTCSFFQITAGMCLMFACQR